MFSESLKKLLPEQLQQITESLAYVFPEFALLGLFLILLLGDLIFKNKAKWGLFIILLVGLIGIFALSINQFSFCQCQEVQTSFLGMIQIDSLGVFFKFIFLLSAILTLLIALKTNFWESTHFKNEFFYLLIALVLGLNIMAMSVNLLMIYIAIELVSISSYVLVFFHFNKESSEGSLKYLIFGAVSSAVMLYGMSWIYGFTGSLFINDPDFINHLSQTPTFPLLLALFLTFGGLFFKLAAVPFHIWTPDAYQAAPSPIVAFFSIAPKAAGLVLAFRLYQSITVLSIQEFEFQSIMIIVALATIIVGNFGALSQKNVKRLMAYSSIAHIGFLLIGLVAENELGHNSILFYLLTYILMNFGAFLLIEVLANMIENPSDKYQLAAYTGLGRKYPLLGVLFSIIVLALIGLPPTVGFTAKFFLFTALWDAYQNSSELLLLILFVIGLFNVVVSLFYYLKIPYFMFFKKENSNGQQIQLPSIFQRLLLLGLSLPLILFFIFPQVLTQVWDWVRF